MKETDICKMQQTVAWFADPPANKKCRLSETTYNRYKEHDETDPKFLLPTASETLLLRHS